MVAARHTDRRRWERRCIRLPVHIEPIDEPGAVGRRLALTINVSPSGLLLECEPSAPPLRVGQRLHVRVGAFALPAERLCPLGQARVVHVRVHGTMLLGLELLGGLRFPLVAPQLVGISEQIQLIKAKLIDVASSDLNVLITGETGTGKNVLAEAIHLLSPRRDRPFIRVNSPSVPPSLFESELFGHERGAFTGADRAAPGYFRLAGEGTIVLDEISEIPPRLQAKLLQVIEEKELIRVGGTEVLPMNARVIATTNADIEEALERGTLREDLFYRLQEVHLHLPPLRERGDDVLLLAEHFRTQFASELQRPCQPLDQDRLEALRMHHWPGNVRELKNVMKRTILHGPSELRHIGKRPHGHHHVRPAAAHGGVSKPASPRVSPPRPLKEVCAEAERKAIMHALSFCGNNRAAAARHLGISYRTMLRKMAAHNIHATRSAQHSRPVEAQ